MTSATILGQLGGLHEMQLQLLESVSEAEAAAQFHPELASLNWYFGRGIYLELHWLREVLLGDADLPRRVSRLFTPEQLPLPTQCAELPPREHLLRWGCEIRDEHLRRLATPGALPDHPLTYDDRLQWFLLQEQAKLYEAMVEVMSQRGLQRQTEAPADFTPLEPAEPLWQTREISQGHYRIGARDEPKAYDNELPPQAVELSSFRIALTPVSNAHYLAFMLDGGYDRSELWSADGAQWLQQHGARAPTYWRQNEQGHWYEVAVNGAAELPPQEPVSGLSHFEAEAFARWIDKRGGEYAGAVLQHEYQWEIAARSGLLRQSGRAWEWCSNRFNHYSGFQPFPGDNTPPCPGSGAPHTLRGASLHTHRALRRPSLRHWAPASARTHFAGTRLVFPPRYQWSESGSRFTKTALQTTIEG